MVDLISKRETISKVPDWNEIIYNLRKGSYHSNDNLYHKKNETQFNGNSSNELEFLIDTLTDQVCEIVKGINPYWRIRIPKEVVSPYFNNREELDEGLLGRIYARVSQSSGIEIDVIQHLMWDRVDIV